MITSKPASLSAQDNFGLICRCKYFVSEPFYTDLTWAEDTATQGCDRSADPAAGMKGRRKPPYQQHSGAKAINPRGLGTESPSNLTLLGQGLIAMTSFVGPRSRGATLWAV
jgi:hypothetical protein